VPCCFSSLLQRPCGGAVGANQLSVQYRRAVSTAVLRLTIICFRYGPGGPSDSAANSKDFHAMIALAEVKLQSRVADADAGGALAGAIGGALGPFGAIFRW
jgi:hypothetical protein